MGVDHGRFALILHAGLTIALVDSADAAFTAQTVNRPDRMTAMLAPGFAERV